MDPEITDRRRIAGSRVLVCGAGLLGINVVEGLLEAGFGHLVVTDGRGYSVRHVTEKHPEAAVTCLGNTVRELDGWSYDVVIGCLSDVPSRLFVNSRAKEYGVPYIDGTAAGGRGRVQVVLSEGPCLECGINRAFRSYGRHTVIDTDPAMAAGIARIMVAEALKIASGHPDTCVRGILYYNVSDGLMNTIQIDIDSRCPNHERDREKRHIVSDICGFDENTYGRGAVSCMSRTVSYMQSALEISR